MDRLAKFVFCLCLGSEEDRRSIANILYLYLLRPLAYRQLPLPSGKVQRPRRCLGGQAYRQEEQDDQIFV